MADPQSDKNFEETLTIARAWVNGAESTTEGRRIAQALLDSVARSAEVSRIAELERDLGLERESHEVTKRMLADRDNILEHETLDHVYPPRSPERTRCGRRYRITLAGHQPIDTTYICERDHGHEGACGAADNKPWEIPSSEPLGAGETPRTDDVLREVRALFATVDWNDADAANNAQHRGLCMVEERARLLEHELARKQEVIDRLMLEHCPEEMTEEQVREWGEHQVPAPSATGTTDREGFYEKLWKDVCSLQRGDAVGVFERVERYYREQEAKVPHSLDSTGASK